MKNEALGDGWLHPSFVMAIVYFVNGTVRKRKVVKLIQKSFRAIHDRSRGSNMTNGRGTSAQAFPFTRMLEERQTVNSSADPIPGCLIQWSKDIIVQNVTKAKGISAITVAV